MKKDDIEELKKRFIYHYVLIMSGVVFFFAVYFQFFVYAPKISLYFVVGLVFFLYGYTFLKERYTADQMMHIYMVCGCLFNFYVMLTFWDNSIASCMNLFPAPLVAFMLFGRKETIFYTLFVMIEILSCYLVHQFFNFNFPRYERGEVYITDGLIFSYNLIISILVLTYHSKIDKVKILAENKSQKSTKNLIKEQKTDVLPKMPENEILNEVVADENLFQQIEKMMEEKKLFKNPKLNIAILSTDLEVHYTDISKIIRQKGYQNFNNYLNIYRVNYVKKLIAENNLQKVTLMYIYTEAGFSSQATFNRVFKQIEGSTPSEYIALHS